VVVLVAVIGAAAYFGWRAWSNSILAELLAPAPKTPNAQPQPLAAPPLPSTVPKPKGHVLLTEITGPEPFWNAADIEPVVRPRLGELDACYEQGIDRKNKSEHELDVTVTADKNGLVTEATCDVDGSDERAELKALCTCVQARVSSWRFPASHGRVGLVVSGRFNLEFNAKYR
jgi:hypothetical protein